MENQVCGIYMILNKTNGKLYIGSSYNIDKRFGDHLSRLKNNKHPNIHLQNAVNKYGLTSFYFSVIEECKKEDLIVKEQFHINNNKWGNLYNKTKIAYGGGSDAVEVELYLLDLSGNIINQYKSGVHLAIDLKLSITPYPTINTKAILKKKYRIVTVKYYNENLKTILTWRKYSNRTTYIKELNKIPLYILTKENEEHKCYTLKETATFLSMTSEGVRQMMLNKNVKFHLKSGFTIATVRKKD